MDDTFRLDQGRKLTWRDYRHVIIRRRWWLLGPLFAIGLLGLVVGHLWPPLYRSEALILVEQQQVPQQYVTPNVVANLQDRLESMTQQILSRTRLQRLIEQFNLYRKERTHMTLDEVIDKMRQYIHLELVQAPGRPGSLTAFRLSFEGESPQTAQRVTNELTALFIEENLQARAQQSAGTTSFLENQLEEARQNLSQQERQLREFKARSLGELPEQSQANLEILGVLQSQLHASSNELGRAKQQKTYLESLQSLHQAPQAQSQSGQSGSAPAQAPAGRKVRELRRELVELEAKYTPQHPDVVRLREEIARLESPSASSDRQQASDDAALAESGGAETQNSIEVESRLKAVAVEIQDRTQEIDDLRKQIAAYQSHLNSTPLREQQLAELTRNYDNSHDYYQSLFQKKLQSELATNLEKRQQGEQFRLIDPPTLPQKPAEPNRTQITLVGWLLGLFAGVGLMALREVTDESLRSQEELFALSKLPLLASLPVLHSPAVQQRERWHRVLEAATITTAFLISVGTSIYSCLSR